MMQTPQFRWENNVIYDHDLPVARFAYDPEGKRQIRLCAVRLTRRGDPLVDWNLSWHYGRCCATSRLLALEAQTPAPDRLTLDIAAESPDRMYGAQTRIALSVDPARGCYRFDASSDLTVNTFPFDSWRTIDSEAFLSRMAVFPSEFANFLPLGSYAYHAPVLSETKKWQAFVYENGAGGWNRVPQHHLNTPDKYNLRFAPGRCRMGFVDDPGGNPCIELMERTPAASNGGICWCMNDAHLHVDKFSLNLRHRVRYALYLFLPEETAEILRTASDYAYAPGEKALYDRPRITHDGRCDFETGFDFTAADDGFQYWLPMGEVRYTAWAATGGRNGGRCLLNATPEPARVWWQAEGTNAPVVRDGLRYRVSVWARTEALRGSARLEAWDQALPDAPVLSEALDGDCEWRRLTAEVEIASNGTPLPGRLCLRLIHDGVGHSRFDDLAIEPLGTFK